MVKNSRVMVDGILESFEADQTRPAIARMFSRSARPWRWCRVPQFALSAELQAMLPRRQSPAGRRGGAYRIDTNCPQLTEIDRVLRAAAGPPSGPLCL